MLYLATASTEPVRDAMRAGLLGVIAQPGSNSLDGLDGLPWVADNGCFADDWEPERWLRWLTRQTAHTASCLFATVPDVVGDHQATLERWGEWAPRVEALGFPPAFVLQDGADPADVEALDARAVFIGGDPRRHPEWKLGPEARAIATDARRRGLHVHMGRVNSRKRIRYALDFCDTADGTYLKYGPRINLPRLLRFLRTAHAEAAHPRLAL